MKVCVIGGGSTYTPELIEGFIRFHEEFPVDTVYLLDVEEGRKKLDLVAGLANRMIEYSRVKIELKATLNPEEAIRDSKFVIFQFRPGFLEGRISDEEIPLKYGLIGQETTGIGGFACALRGMPMIERYVNLVKRLSPDAFIVNFTNPSGMMSEFIINYLGYERCIGLCNIPINLLQEIADRIGGERKALFLKYYGLNHLSWLENVYLNGKDITEALWDKMKLEMKNIPKTDFPYEFINTLGLIPNPYLRYYYMTKTMYEREMEDLRGKGCRGKVVKEIEGELLKLYADPNLREKPKLLEERGGSMYSTAAVELMRDIYNDANSIHIVNVKNRAAVSNLPVDYVLEIPALIGARGASSISIGAARLETVGLIHIVKSFERLTIEAYVKRDEAYAKKALLIHPLGPGIENIDALWQDLKKANAEYYTYLE